MIKRKDGLKLAARLALDIVEYRAEIERLRIERMRFYMAAKACLADVSASDLHAIVVEMEADFKAALKEARATYEQHHTPTFCKWPNCPKGDQSPPRGRCECSI